MLFRITAFELKYRAARPATYIYFAILFILAFGAIASDSITIGGGTGQVKENAPTVLASMMVILTALPGLLIISAIMGVPVMRDFEHRTEGMMFTTPIKKRDYLLGRFLGSFIIALLVSTGMLLGFMLGSVMPWLDKEQYLPFNFWHFFQPFLVFVVPNLFFTGAVFFMGGTLSRRMATVFVQGMAVLVTYLILSTLVRDIQDRSFAAIADPIGMITTRVISQYWTVAEQNTQVFPLEGYLLWNRLLFLGLGIVALAVTYAFFTFEAPNRAGKDRKTIPGERPLSTGLPGVTTQRGGSVALEQVLALMRIYFREIVRSVPFLTIVALGFASMFINAQYFNQMYGLKVLPLTYYMLDLISQFNLFFIILIVFYTGELIWRERDLNMNQIFDALPVNQYVAPVAKFLALTGVFVVLLFGLILAGMGIQAVNGYYHFEVPVYIGELFTETLLFLILYSMLGFFIQAMSNHKFVGHAIIVVFFILTSLVAEQLGIEHKLFQFGSGELGSYSDMNRFGPYVPSFAWFQLYWLMLGVGMFVAAVLFSMRGMDTAIKTRWQLARQRFTRGSAWVGGGAGVVFALTGGFIFYNTNILHEYASSKTIEERQAAYERTLKVYKDIPQPRIVETRLKVDIHPRSRDMEVEGYYILKNKTSQPIEVVHVQMAYQQEAKPVYVRFEGGAKVEKEFKEFDYTLYRLAKPMQPGDSLRLDWRIDFVTNGFEEGDPNTDVVANGTFINNLYFPSFGYDDNRELSDDDERRKKGLPERARMRDRDDPIGLKISLVGDDADQIRFGATLSTDPDQIAIAPGYLKREWTENGRRYFEYDMDVPMFNFYCILSARYEVIKEVWEGPDGKPINLEIYYHPGHTYNLHRMMKGMKDALAYNWKNFSPYQFRQMRILEFPRYAMFAQSFANTVPFSEGLGFVTQIDTEKDDVDMVYYVTAHEIGHQWWGHQVCEAQVRGNAMLSETMSQYTALMAMKHTYPREMMQKFLKYELDSYLQGRATEIKKEMPLELVENQGYIHYRKGSLVMYALQDLVGEDSVNAALRRFVRDWAWRSDPYPTSEDLLGYFRAVTPDSLSYLITDLFETITLYENRTENVTSKPLANGQYQVDLTFSTTKYRADSLGNESPVPMNDWVDVGVYGKTAAGKDSLIYLQKHRIPAGNSQRISVTVKGKPEKAGVDPLNILIDRNPEDNVKPVASSL
jgi:ABC-type transport system involved in multi-copper enzyme maturation permease subunit